MEERTSPCTTRSCGRAKHPGGHTEQLRRRRIYVCSPYRPQAHDPETARKELEANLERARAACRAVTGLGGIPICPHLFFTQFLRDDKPEERRAGRDMGLELLRDCDELWCFSARISEGMLEEIALASRLRIPVRTFSDDAEWPAGKKIRRTASEVREGRSRKADGLAGGLPDPMALMKDVLAILFEDGM